MFWGAEYFSVSEYHRHTCNFFTLLEQRAMWLVAVDITMTWTEMVVMTCIFCQSDLRK